MSRLNRIVATWCKQQERYPAGGCYEPPKHDIYKQKIAYTSLLGIRCYQIPCDECAWNPESKLLDKLKELESYAKQMDCIKSHSNGYER